jgi:hypothetical protein
MQRFRSAAISVACLALLAIPATAGAKVHNSASAPGCTVTASASPSWLNINASNLTTGTLYTIAVVTPGGATMGDVMFPSATGTLTDTNLPANYVGTYSVSISKTKGSTVASCSVDVS